MKPIPPKFYKQQAAQAMIEFALVFPVLIFLLYGILEMGRVMFIYISVINSSKEAARFGSSVGNPGAYRYVDCAEMIEAARRSAILNTIATEDVIITYDEGPGSGAKFGGAECGDSAVDEREIKLGDRVNVQVTLTYSPIMPVSWASFPVTASASRTIIKSVKVASSDAGELGTPAVQFVNREPFTVLESAGDLNVDLVLSNPSTEVVVVPLILSGVAASGQDYVLATTTVTFPVNDQFERVILTIIDDLLDEEDFEQLMIRIGTPVNALKGSPTLYTVNIQDNDLPPDIFFVTASSDSSKPENAGAASVVVGLSTVSGRAVTFAYTSDVGTATPGVDYTIPPMPVTIPAGQMSVATALVLINDTLYELDETAGLRLSSAVNATIVAPSTHTVLITNDDPPPLVSFDVETSVTSETVGVLRLALRLDRISAVDATVTLIVDAASTATNLQDYTLPTMTFTIPAGEREAEVVIQITNDLEPPAPLEPIETLVLRINGVLHATIGAPFVHTASIKETNSTPDVSFISAGNSVNEDAGTVAVRIVLSETFTADIGVTFSVAGSARAGFDYSAVTLSPVVIRAGAVSVDILVPITDDLRDELNETVILTITGAPGAEILDPFSYIMVILDNDQPPVVAFTQAASSVEEGSGVLTLNVALSEASDLDITVAFVTSGNARLNIDYQVLTSGPLAFSPGLTSQTIQVNILDDDVFTGSRNIQFSLTTPTNGTVGAPSSHVVDIIENEICPTLIGWTLDGKNAYTTVSLPTSAATITLTSLTVTQQGGQQLKVVDLGTNNTIFQGSANGSPVTITNFKNGADLTLSGAGGGKVLLLTFQDTITLTGSYSVSLSWNNGCVISKP